MSETKSGFLVGSDPKAQQRELERVLRLPAAERRLRLREMAEQARHDAEQAAERRVAALRD